MSDLTLIQFDKDYSKLIESIRTQATPFPRDSIEKRLARTARARSDEMFFAAIYFPHYIELADGYQDIWKDPDAKIDWVKAGFATYHPTFFDLCKLRNQFNLLAGHRESAKDTLIGNRRARTRRREILLSLLPVLLALLQFALLLGLVLTVAAAPGSWLMEPRLCVVSGLGHDCT